MGLSKNGDHCTFKSNLLDTNAWKIRLKWVYHMFVVMWEEELSMNSVLSLFYHDLGYTECGRAAQFWDLHIIRCLFLSGCRVYV